VPVIRNRLPRMDDAELIKLIRHELLPFSHTVSQHDASAISEIPRRLSLGKTLVASLSRTSTPIAFIHYIVTGDVIYVDMLVTHPQHRNRKWGKKLMAKCEADAIAQHCAAIRLFVDQSNAKALQFYSDLGYSAISFHSDIRCYEMLKPLASYSSYTSP